jgi:plastocyanin
VPAPTNTPNVISGKVAVSISGAYGTFGFNPSTLSIKTSTTVTWTNDTNAPHTVTSDTGDPASFSGSLMHNGATFSFTFSFTFNSPGTYGYHCSVHPYMTATITVTA